MRTGALLTNSMASPESSQRKSSEFVKPINGSWRKFNTITEVSVEKKTAQPVSFLLSVVKVLMSDSEEATRSVMRRRAACEKWKITQRDYYFEQKRRLANRPEYKAHRREMYRERERRARRERREKRRESEERREIDEDEDEGG